MSEVDEDVTFRGHLLSYFCNLLPLVVAVFALAITGLFITLFTLVAIDLDSSTAVVAVVNIPGLVAIIAATGYLLSRCRKTDDDVDLDELL